AGRGVAIVSTSVFHALHAGHWPCHLGLCPPHSVQVYMVLAFATPITGYGSSSGVTTAVPSFPTTTPAAWLATFTAATRSAPAPSIAPSVAITVSPAPETSYTSRACAGM